jgi:hypothetical protein
MNRIIELLNHKNHYLEKFYSLNEGQIILISKDDYSQLEEFYKGRESILEAIKYIDQQLDEAQNEPMLDPYESEKREIATCLAIKEEYVSRILAQDLEILATIESAKSNIIRELQEVRKTKKAVQSYHSKQAGHRLNEKA